MKKKLAKIILSAILFILAIMIPFSDNWISQGIYLIAYLVVGWEIIQKAIRNILKGKVFDENFLMTIATVGALAIGEFPEAVAVMLFYQIGELFQSYAVDQSRKSIASLMDIRPDFANLEKVDGTIEKVNPELIKVGDKIVIKPGEKVPLDGKVIEGNTSLDTKALTGESLPREVEVGNEVLSGCINLAGVIKVEVSKEFGESTVSKILNLVENASSKKSKSENFITKFAKYYTPIVVLIALVLAILPPLILQDGSFTSWLYRALAFLVVSCPCALVISVPLSFFGGIGGASKMGILIKGSNYLEALAKTEMVVFDKTGTLTEGNFKVEEIHAEGISQEELLELVAHAESFSNHPIAMSVKEAYAKEIDKNLVSHVEELSGMGIKAEVKGRVLYVGNQTLINRKGIQTIQTNSVGTILHVAIDGEYAGYLTISDQIKPDAKKAIKELREQQIKKLIMLTGDRKNVAESVAKELKLDGFYAELLPNEKVEKVEKLLKEKTEKGKLVFVGDGINDAPVLALADIGIAMGGLGADSAIEAADIVIMTDEPSKIKRAIELSKKTMRIVKQNIGFAICIKVAVLILTAIGLSTMWEAVFADVGVTVIAILNAFRVLRIKKDA